MLRSLDPVSSAALVSLSSLTFSAPLLEARYAVMKRRELLFRGVASAIGFVLAPSPSGAEGQPKKRILFFTKSSEVAPGYAVVPPEK